MHQNQNQNKIHIPVLLEEVLRYLDPKPGNTYLDLTAGYGGHAERVLEKTLGAHSVLVDRDKNAVDYLKQKFDQKSAVIRHQDFYQASLDLSKEGTQFDLILAAVLLNGAIVVGDDALHDGAAGQQVVVRPGVEAKGVAGGELGRAA